MKIFNYFAINEKEKQLFYIQNVNISVQDRLLKRKQT